MPNQIELLGDHPPTPSEFDRWLKCNDIAATPTKVHRSLTSKIPTTDKQLIEWLGTKLFHHHHADYRIAKLKENYKKLGFDKYAEQNRKLPIADKTKKGNATEVLLTEYIESCLKRSLIKVYKLKYNPNVDQALKGDDTLMVDILPGKVDTVKIYLGEAKFRTIPNKKVITDIAKALSKDKKPISYSFLVDELGRDASTRDLANILDEFIIDDIKGKGNLTYVGLLFSNSNTSTYVETHLNSDNPHMVMISVSTDDAQHLIDQAFLHAEHLVKNPDLV